MRLQVDDEPSIFCRRLSGLPSDEHSSVEASSEPSETDRSRLGRSRSMEAAPRSSSSVTLTCLARVLYKGLLLAVGTALLLLAVTSFCHDHEEILARDLTADFVLAPRSALRRNMATRMSPSSPSPWQDSSWVQRVLRSGTPAKAGGYSVLVTGAAGFIGSFASLAMARKGWGVVGVDNFDAHSNSTLKAEREQWLLRKARTLIVHGDINDQVMLRALFELVPFTHVVHLAAQVEAEFGDEFEAGVDEPPARAFVHSNVAGLVSLLEACIWGKPKPVFVWASSEAVYGLDRAGLASETDRTDTPGSLYAASKKTGEEIVHVYNHVHGVSVTTLRFFTVYGPFGRPDSVLLNLTESVLRGTPIARSSRARDYTFIDDIVNGVIAAAETATKSLSKSKSAREDSRGRRTVAQFRVLNLGSGRCVSVDRMVEFVERFLGRQAVRGEGPVGSSGVPPPHYAAANLTLARKHLGYRPRTSLRTGVHKFLFWYQRYRMESAVVARGSGGSGHRQNSRSSGDDE